MLLQVVDSFTDVPFAGNPAAVAVLDVFPSEERMQLIAREMNLSETAFVVARADGEMDLRWYTPEAEVDLCGHATLATAHVVGGTLRFHTRSGVLTTWPDEEGRISMDFPGDPVAQIPIPSELSGLEPKGCYAGRFDTLVELSEAGAVRSARPDLAKIAAVGSRGVIITAAGDRPGIASVSRVFAPNVGIAEDPVTGSAHCTLAGFWSERTGEKVLVGEQASSRGGTVHMRVEGDRVVLSGNAVTVSEVRLLA